MNSLRYYLALLVVMGVPPALVFWISIHPFVKFWREVGVWRTYVVHAAMILAVGVVVFQLRETLLRARFGPQPVLMAVAVVVYVLAIGVALQRRKGLAVAQLVGLPELAPHRADSRLSTSGIYSRVRHPRYLELLLFLLGHALLTNYLAVYVALGVCLAGFPVIVYFEEKELRERFGRQHELYCARVPRFIPGF